MLAEGQELEVFVTHVEQAGSFVWLWAQIDLDREEFDQLMSQVQKRASSLSTVDLQTLEVGDVCLALYQEDQNWYRAQVENVDKLRGSVKVCFYDYGNTEEIPGRDLRKGESKYFELSPQAVPFQMSNIEASNGNAWLPKEFELLQEQLRYNVFFGQVKQIGSIGNPPILSLFHEVGSTTSVANRLISEGIGRKCVTIRQTSAIPMTLLKPGMCYHVYMAFFNSAVDFWLQLAENSHQLETLNSEMAGNKRAPLIPMPVSQVKTSTVCIAYATEYGAYYRAVVSNIRQRENKCTVTYVDYGNKEEKKLGELYSLHDSFTRLSSQGIPCCLFGANAKAADIDRYISSEVLQARVMKVTNSGVHVVTLHESQPDSATFVQQVNKQKITSGIYHYTPVQFNLGSTVPVCISHVEDTGMFYCQLLENRFEIDQLMLDLQQFYRSNSYQATSLKKGEAVIVRNGKEDVYHRAEVISASRHEVHVKYVDLGDTESVPHSKVWMIDQRHVTLPSQAICCQLDGVETFAPSAVASFLRTYESRKTLMAKVVLKTPKYCDVQLVDTNSNHKDIYLISLLQEKTAVQSSGPKRGLDGYIEPLIEEGMWEDVMVTYVETPDSFYCKLVSSEDEFNTMSDQMEVYCNSLRPGQGRLLPATVGAPCIAKDEDKVWYRAVVRGVGKDGSAEVQFVDFGSCGSVPLADLVAMDPKFMRLPIQSVRCGLQGVFCRGNSHWSNDEIEKFSTVGDYNQLVLFASHDSQSDRFLVEMYGPYLDDANTVNINEAFGTEFRKLSRSYQSHKPPPSFRGSHPPPGSSKTMKNQDVGSGFVGESSDTDSLKSSISSVNTREKIRMEEMTSSGMSNSNRAASHQKRVIQPGGSTGWASWEGGGLKELTIQEAEIGFGDTVYVAFSESPEKFWCQPVVSSDRLSKMAEQLNEEYSNMGSNQLLLQSPRIGQLCCALYAEDYSWYRAKIKDIKGHNARVFFIDYGNEENISVSTLKQLREKYTLLPSQAVECCLANIKPNGLSWSSQACARFRTLYSDKELQIQSLSRKGITHFVELGDVGRRGGNIGQILVHTGFAAIVQNQFRSEAALGAERNSSHDYGRASPTVLAKFERTRLTPGEAADVNIVYVVDPQNFFCQLTKNSSLLEDVMHTVAKDFSMQDIAIKRIVRPRIGQICGAKYDIENKWYRAEVIATDGSQVKVSFVDYGDEQWIGTEGLKTLKKEHIELPAQAIKCSLLDVVPTASRWTSEMVSTFEELVYDKNLVAQVLTESDGIYGVRLIVPGIGRRHDYSVSDRLVQLGLARHCVERGRILKGRSIAEPLPFAREESLELETTGLSFGKKHRIHLTWVCNPKDFWCQLADTCDQASNLSDELNETYHSLRINEEAMKNPDVGQYCIAPKESDGSWYRGRIISRHGPEFEVRFVDWGDTEELPGAKLKKIRNQFAQIPCLAFRCGLQGVEPQSGGKWDDAVAPIFAELLQRTITLTVFDKVGEKYIVRLQDENGADISTKITSLGMQRSRINSTTNPQPTVEAVRYLEKELSFVKAGQTVSVQVMHVKSYTSFFCQLQNKIMARDEMMDKLDEYCNSRNEGKIEDAQPGMYCVARFSEDGGWYRVQIIRKETRMDYLVNYIDYGNEEVVNIRDIRPLLPQFTRLPAQAIECSLSGISVIGKTAELTKKLLSLTEGKDMKAEVFSVSETKLDVDLIDASNGLIINYELNRIYKAKQPAVQISDRLYAKPSTSVLPATPTSSKKTTFAKRPLLLKERIVVYTSHIESPTKFYLQVASEEDELSKLANKLNEEYSAMSTSQSRLQIPTVGNVCVAQFSEDENWYRGTIIELSGTQVTVRFLDYGNTDKVHTAELKDVTDKYLNIPGFAIECSLKVSGEITKEASAKFEELMMAEEADITAEFLDSKLLPVPTKVVVNGTDIIGALGLAADTTQPTYKAPLISSGIKVKVIPTTIESPSSIYVQIAATEDESQKVVDDVNDFYTNLGKEDLVLADPLGGQACVAQFSEDEAWYRAIISNITDNQATVTFIDYGNTDVVHLDSLKEVTDEFLKIPPYAIKCKLRNASEPSAGWPDEVCSALESLLLDEEALVATEFHTTNIPVEADLFINARNVRDMLNLEKYTETVESDRSESTETAAEPTYATPVAPGGEVSVRICTSYSPTYFYVQLLEDEGELEAYSTKLQEEYTRYENLKNRQDQVVVIQSEVSACKVMEEADGKKPDEELAEEAQTCSEDNGTLQMEDGRDEEEEQIEADFDSAYEGEEDTDTQREDNTLHEEVATNTEDRNVEGQFEDIESTSDRNMLSEENSQVARDKDSENSEKESQNIAEEDHPEEAAAKNIVDEDNNDSEAVKDENGAKIVEIEENIDKEEEKRGSDTDEQEAITDISDENEKKGKTYDEERYHPGDAKSQEDPMSMTKEEISNLHEEIEEKMTKAEEDAIHDTKGKRVLEVETESEEICVQGNYDVQENVHESLEGQEFEVTESEQILVQDSEVLKENVEESSKRQEFEVIESEQILVQDSHVLQENVEESPEGQEFEVTESEQILVQDGHVLQENVEESPEGEKFDVHESEKILMQDKNDVQENVKESPEDQEIEVGEQTSTVVNFNVETTGDGPSELNDTETEKIVHELEADNTEKENKRAEESKEVGSMDKVEEEDDSNNQVVLDGEMQPKEAEVFLDFQISHAKIGMACVVKCPRDNVWYRATVVSVTESEANVLLVDYGKLTTVEVSNMMQVSEEHLTRAPYAYHCQLDGVREPSDGWTSENNETFTLALEGSDLKMSFVTGTEPFKVKLKVGEDLVLPNLPLDWCSQESEDAAIEATCSLPEVEINAEVVDEDDLDLIGASEVGATEKDDEPCRSYPVRNFTKGQRLHVYASDVPSLLHFYLQLVSEEENLTSLADEINEFYSANSGGLEALKYPEVNRPCIAQYTDEEGNAAWYRAQITDINGDVANVLFVDYGNSECVIVDELKEINEEYLKVAPYALCCQISSDIPDDLVEWFTDVVMNAEQLEAEVLVEDTPLIVKLSVDGKPVEDLAKNEMDATQSNGEKDTGPEEKDVKDKTKTKFEEPADTEEGDKDTAAEFPDPDTPDREPNQDEELRSPRFTDDTLEKVHDTYPSPDSGVGLGLGLDAGERYEAYVSYVESPSQFWIQRADSEQTLQEIGVALENAEKTTVERKEMRVGEVFAARYSEDGTWQRVKVTRQPAEDQVDVLYIDYGNLDVVSVDDLCHLPDDLRLSRLSPQALNCRLSDVRAADEVWSDEANTYFEDTVLGKTLLAEIVKMNITDENSTDDDKSMSIRLLDMGILIATKLKEAGYAVDDPINKCLEKDDPDDEQDAAVGLAPKISEEGERKAKEDVSKEPCAEDSVILPMLLPVNEQTPVYISYAESPSNFFIQLADTHQLDNLNELMQQTYTDLEETDKFYTDLNCGMLCAAYSPEDHSWYRAKVLNIEDDGKVFVNYIDFGHSETLEDNVKPLLRMFLDIPAQAVQCTLSGICHLAHEEGFSQDCIEMFIAETGMQRELIAEVQTFYGTPGPQGDGIVQTVKLFVDGSSVGDLLVDSGFATYSSECEAFPTIRNPRIHEDDRIPVHITSVVSPDNFMCQLAKPSIAELPLLVDKIHDYCTGDEDTKIIDPKVGMACLAMSSKDSGWFRAEITGIQESEISVQFVDYGNTDKIDKSKVKSIPADMLSLPRLVIPCRLHGVEPIGREWDDTSCARFEELCYCENCELTAKVMSLQYDDGGTSAPIAVVQLLDKDGQCNIGDMLVDGGYARRQEGFLSSSILGYSMSFLEESQSEADPVLLVDYLHGESPSIFTCQLSSSKHKLEALMEELNKSDEDKEPMSENDIKVGQMCLAQYGSDLWCRAVITAVQEDVCEVRFVDYGNRSLINRNKIQSLHIYHQKLPEQAVTCQLAGIETEEWTQEAKSFFEEMCVGKELAAKVVGELGEEGVLLVYLYDKADISGESINTQLVAKDYAWLSTLRDTVENSDPAALEQNQEELEDSFLEVSLLKSSSFGSLKNSDSEPELESESIKFKNISLEEGEICNMFVVEAVDPDNIICQAADSSSELTELMEYLQENYKESESLQAIEVHPGQACVVQCPQDGTWYRGQVIQIEDDGKIQVYYVDYGKREVVELSRARLMVPDRKLVSLPAQAVLCVLAGVSPITELWQEDVKVLLQDTICDNECSVEVTVVAIEDDGRILVNIATSDKEDLGRILAQNKCAKIMEDGDESEDGDSLAYKQRDLAVNEEYDVALTVVVDPSQFWCQIEIEKLEDLKCRLNEYYKNKKLVAVSNPQEGTVGVVYSTAHGGWCRLRIESVFQTTASVRLVDFGSVETTSVTEIYPLKKRFAITPPHAVQCSLYNAKPRIGGEWCDKANDSLDSFRQHPMTMRICTMSRESQECINVEVVLKRKDSDVSVLRFLIDEKLAKETEDTGANTPIQKDPDVETDEDEDW